MTTGRAVDRDRAARLVLGGAALVAGLSVVAILAFLLWFCRPLVEDGGAVWSWTWRPHEGRFGILPMVAGSLFLAVSALALALPVALGLVLFTHGLGPRRLGRIVLVIVHVMTGIPTILYAFVSAMVLVPLTRAVFREGSGYAWVTAAPVLAVLVLPTLVLLLAAWWRTIGEDVRVTCAALGLSRVQTALHVVLPVARRGLLAAALLGFARAVGDTMIALVLSGNVPRVPTAATDGLRTLTAHIALVHATDTQQRAWTSIFACGLVLLLLTAAISIAVRVLAGPDRRSRRVRLAR